VTLILLALLLACGGAGTFMASAAGIWALGGPSATVDVGGLVLTLDIAPGPYFLRELLPVSVSLTNHTRATVHVPRGEGMSGCGGAFNVTQDGGGAPTYQMPTTPFIFSCPLMPLDDLAPGQTRSAPDLLLPLQASGHLTLTAHVAFFRMNPFAGREPALSLTVAPSAPPDRTLNLWRHTSRVIVLGPPGALAHLVYMFNASAGGCGTGNFGWEPLRLPVLDAHPCAGRYGTWTYAVGAPGYAVASETLFAAQLG
jgi:hypothetical protein